MRDRVECGVFYMDAFGDWIDQFIDQAHRNIPKMTFRKVDIKQYFASHPFDVGRFAFPPPTMLKELALVFERYDCLILPVIQVLVQ